ncbi:copper resistance protein B [Qipengyuania atrilutea]|uniref:Copper resistance protein B n=1 Tax=Qipengyuania atrilutea TaxID=2744473 RepID=A0A850GZE4_9SPHN|nr:copper resistance protein B [Actirhodobacter atriluteus]NVD44991.1 copper resistance protein B [Actirhodobacter atriluteus]
MRTALLPGIAMSALASPVAAQDHSMHGSHGEPAQDQTECEKEAARHRAMGHAVPAGECAPPESPEKDRAEMDHAQMDHSEMDHSQMDHGAMNHSEMDHGAMHGSEAEIPILPPPPSAGSGPPTAADAIWGVDAMRDSRGALARDGGGMMTSGLILDRFEYRFRGGEDGFLWDGDAWYGGDLNRVWLESEGEGDFEGGVEDADVALLYGRAISPWFDLQAGVRQDLTGPKRTYLDLGIQGLAPYLFEVEADVYVSNKGDVTATAEVELDQRITQRLVIQPRAEVSLSAQDVPELGIGAGLDTIEAGVRLRYEIAREFAPYIGIEQEWKTGGSADYARDAGEDPSATNYVLGVHFWF